MKTLFILFKFTFYQLLSYVLSRRGCCTEFLHLEKYNLKIFSLQTDHMNFIYIQNDGMTRASAF